MTRPRMGRFTATGIALFLAVLLVAPTAYAQRFNPEQMRERMMAQIDETIKSLELEGETADTVRAILVERSEKQFGMMAEMRGGQNRGAMREAMATLQEETAKKLSEVLSEEKLEAWKTLEASRRGAMRRRPGGN